MSADTNNKVSIMIMGKEYQIGCPPEEEQGLIQAAQHLDKQMRKIRDSGKVIGLERIAIMTALNLSHELVLSQNHSQQNNPDEQLSRVNQKLDSALARFRQLEL